MMEKIIPIIIIVVAFGVMFYSVFSLLGSFDNMPENISWNFSLESIKSFFLAQMKSSLEKQGQETSETEDNVQTSGDSDDSASLPSSPKPKNGYTINLSETPSTPVPKPAVTINTSIISSPQEGEALNTTNDVTFEFSSRVTPKETEGQITFETKIEGLDEDWQLTYSNDRTINFPPGPKEYTFLVRAKIEFWKGEEYKNYTDPTPAKRTFKINTSPYFGKVKISYIEKRDYNGVTGSLITLYTYLDSNEKVNITGWRIEGENGGFTIPQGTEKYDPSYNLLPSENVFRQDIILNYYDLVYLSSEKNPLGRNRDFRLNKCFGYLKNYYNFPVDFYGNCPLSQREDVFSLEDCCQKYILELGQCEEPNYWENPWLYSYTNCVNYVNNNLNYTGCYRNHSNDEDFLQDDWYIYMDRNFVGRGIDTFYLRDKSGLLVDKYEYEDLCCEY